VTWRRRHRTSPFLRYRPFQEPKLAGGGGCAALVRSPNTASLPWPRLRLPVIASAPGAGLRAPSRPRPPTPPLAPPLVGRRAMMCKLIHMATGASFQQHCPAPRKGAAKRPCWGKTRERARDRRGREASQARNAGRHLWAGGTCIRAPPRGGSTASAARWLRRTRPNAERRRRETAGRHWTRVIRQGYPSIRRTETEPDLRMRGWALDTYPPQPRIQTQTPARFCKATDAYRPDHPREENHRRESY
jgi:hypothetical protein